VTHLLRPAETQVFEVAYADFGMRKYHEKADRIFQKNTAGARKL